MKKWFALLLTLALLIILSYFCFLNKSKHIENDLLLKANISYANENMAWVKIKGLEGNNLSQTRTLVLEGVAQNQNEREKAELMARQVEGIQDVKNHITILYKEPTSEEKEMFIPEEKKFIYKISATKEQGKKVILIKGVVPNDKIHQKLITQAKKLFGEMNIIDELEENEGTPQGWYKSAKLGIKHLQTTQYGHFEIINDEFNFEGQMETKEKKLKLLNSLNKNLDNYYVGNYTINTPKIKISCQKEITRLVSKHNIHFHYNKAHIKKESYLLLNNIAHTIKNICHEEVVIVEGHTDSSGKKSYNKELSIKRANSVKNYLLTQGVEKLRIEAIGYGESRPIASNKTKNGKRQNRRIEFKIKTLK